MKLLLETNAFIASKTMEGIVIQQKNKANFYTGLLLFIVGILSYILYYFCEGTHLPRKWMEWIFDPIMLYTSYISLAATIFFLAKGIFFKKSKPILFDRHTKELHLRFEKIPFREIENLHSISFPFIGGNLINIKFKHKNLPKSLIYGLSIVKTTSEIDLLMNEINELMKDKGY